MEDKEKDEITEEKQETNEFLSDRLVGDVQGCLCRQKPDAAGESLSAKPPIPNVRPLQRRWCAARLQTVCFERNDSGERTDRKRQGPNTAVRKHRDTAP